MRKVQSKRTLAHSGIRVMMYMVVISGVFSISDRSTAWAQFGRQGSPADGTSAPVALTILAQWIDRASEKIDFPGGEYEVWRDQILAQGTRAVPLLQERLKSPNWKMRLVATVLFGRLTQPQKYLDYEAALKSQSDRLILSHENIVLHLSGEKVAQLSRPLEGLEDKDAVQFLAERSLQSVGVDGEVAVVGLSLFKDLSTLDVLTQLIQPAYPYIHRRYALLGLKRLGDKRSVPGLLKVIQTGYFPWERQSAAEIVGQIGDRAAISQLEAVIREDKNSQVREATQQAIQKILARER